jgi:hypothetical protein
MSRSRPFTLIAAAIFFVIGLLHLYRLFTHFQVILGSHEIPMSLSYVAILVSVVLAWGCFRESRS